MRMMNAEKKEGITNTLEIRAQSFLSSLGEICCADVNVAPASAKLYTYMGKFLLILMLVSISHLMGDTYMGVFLLILTIWPKSN